MNKKSFILAIVLASILGGLVAVAAFRLFMADEPNYKSIQERQNYLLSDYDDSKIIVPEGLNFVYAAKLVTPGVVHIKTIKQSSGPNYSSPFEQFFGQPRRGPQQGSGSGVIISDDGYIATNYHVVEGSDEIEVILDDNRSYKAKLIGEDPTTDLALLKIEEKGLAFIKYGDSDNVEIGEWVLAVGNPFELTSTVTAGIVSAKGRNINILRRDLGIESFIQTDAVVNPGNSGGALVNLNGQLIGINTAIASPTGSYAGYAFAVPVSLVKKVMDDLLEYGAVQRALLGIQIRDVDAELADELGTSATSGVYIAGVNSGSSADDAGLEEGDVIVGINKNEVKNVAELQEYVARNRPGDKVDVTYIRDGKKENVTATLKNIMGEEKMYKREAAMVVRGAEIKEISEDLKKQLEIEGGVQLTNIKAGKWKEAGIRNEFVIISIDKIKVNSINDLMASLSNKRGGILVEGFYPDGSSAAYAVIWTED